MPRRRNSSKPRAPVTRSQQNPTSMRPFESVDSVQRRSFLSFATSGFCGHLGGPVLYFTDSFDPYSCGFAHSGLRPHPRIRELAEQEAEKHAQELIEEENRCKEKAEKNMRKKVRKKEKRLEKQNAAKALSREDEEGNPGNHGQDHFAELEGGRSGAVGAARAPARATPASETAEDEERSGAPREEERSVQTAEEEEEEEEESAEEKDAGDPAEKRSRELAGTGYRLAAAGQYEQAVGYFTDAIKHDPKEFKLFGNRSLCYERMQQYEKALRDADMALLLEPGWIKGLFRKGKALCGLKRYYEAWRIYREVMALDSSSVEAQQELKRAQTLHLMEMGFSWEESSKALKTHSSMEEAIESLFKEERDAGSENPEQAAVREVDDSSRGEEWRTQRAGRPRAQRTGEPVNPSRVGSLSSPRPGSAVKPKLFPVWVGVLAPCVTYLTLHQLFSRAGTVYSIKMLLEQQCAYVNYTREEDCHRAVQGFNGMVVEGAPLTVRYPSPTLGTDPCRAKECFFWRTIGCTRSDCVFKHDANHKGVDRDKFTSGPGTFRT